MGLPNVYIYGAQKCATTSLHNWFASLPETSTSNPKEPEHFTQGNCKQYEKCFTNTNLITVESTPSGYSQQAPKRLHDSNPDCKIIYIVRNPVDRFLSAYAMYGSRVNEHGIEWRIRWEIDNLPTLNEENDTTGLIRRGIYINVIESLRQYFSDEQLHIVSFDELINDSSNTLKSIAEFVGIESINTTLGHINKSRRKGIAVNEMLSDFYEPYNKQLFDYCGKKMYQ